MRAAPFILLATLAATGCPAAGAPRAVKACQKASEQCALANGLLGVCDTVDCSEGQNAPCFVCRPQH